jgi:hypothetical protein
VQGGEYDQKCVYMYANAKMISFETIPGIEGRGMKKSSRGG